MRQSVSQSAHFVTAAIWNAMVYPIYADGLTVTDDAIKAMLNQCGLMPMKVYRLQGLEWMLLPNRQRKKMGKEKRRMKGKAEMDFWMPWLISLAASLVSVWVVYSRIVHIMIMAIFMEHFTDQVSAELTALEH